MLKTKKSNIRVLFFVWLIIGIFLNPIPINAFNTKTVLFISSYSPQFMTFNDQLRGISELVSKNYEVQVEYMDVRKFNYEDIKENFYNLLKFKTKNYRKYDAVIVGDDAALKFALDNYDDLFKNTKVVFLGASFDENLKMAKKGEVSGGVIEKPSIDENMQLINDIYKDKKNLILITGNKDAYKDEIDRFFSYKSKFKQFNFKNMIIPDKIDGNFLSKLKKINKNTDIVLYVHPYKINTPKDLDVYESVDIISNNVDAPMFTTLDYGIYGNMIGGKVVSQYEQAKLASNIVDKILNNKTNSKDFIDNSKANIWAFNYDNLKKYNIQKHKLPKNSIIINEPIPFLEKYKEIIVPAFFTLTGLISIIIALLITIHKNLKHKDQINRARKIAEDANIAKSNLIATISHELRTPVTVISSANQLLSVLLSKEKLKNDVVIDNKLDIISQNSNRLVRLINNVIDVAKIDCGFYNLKLDHIDIISFIEDTVLSVIPYANSKNLNIIFDTNVEELNMCVDSEKIERVVLNLLSNAIKFSNEGACIFTTVNVDDKYFNLSVQDSGIGISKENINKIFDKFTQVDSGFTRQNEGSGIGLSIVKSFVELHNGTIKVDSQLGVGSIFTVKIPIKYNMKNGDKNQIPSKSNNTNIELSDIFK